MSFDAAAIVARVRQEAARRLLAAAITLQSAARADVSAGNPAPHDDPAPKGAFPKLRTGGGRANIAVAPASVGEIVAGGAVSVGHRGGGAHLFFLAGKGWKGILGTLARERTRIQAVLGGGP
jgi:hypothetical protein